MFYDDGHIMIHVIETDDVQYVREICCWCDMYTLRIIRMTMLNGGIYAIVW